MSHLHREANMSVSIYMAAMTAVEGVRAEARKLEQIAESLEGGILRRLGVASADREPGFPCWQIEGLPGWFNTPLDALEATQRKANGM